MISSKLERFHFLVVNIYITLFYSGFCRQRILYHFGFHSHAQRHGAEVYELRDDRVGINCCSCLYDLSTTSSTRRYHHVQLHENPQQ